MNLDKLNLPEYEPFVTKPAPLNRRVLQQCVRASGLPVVAYMCVGHDWRPVVWLPSGEVRGL